MPPKSKAQTVTAGRNPDEFLANVIDPALAYLSVCMGRKMGGDRARVIMLAIAWQESGLRHRMQIRGPARGYWQFESGGGCIGVLAHEASKAAAKACCMACGCEPKAAAVHTTLANDDLLAAYFARLLLWTDPKPLPALGDAEGAWAYYLRNWQPGKPHPRRWKAAYDMAMDTVATTLDTAAQGPERTIMSSTTKTPDALADELEAAVKRATDASHSRSIADEATKYGKIVLTLVLDNLPAIIAALRDKAKEEGQ